MADLGNKEIVDLSLIPDPLNGDIYVVKSDADYRVRIGAANGLPYLGADGIIPASMLPAAGGDGTVTSVAVTGGTGISITGSPITTSGTIAISLSSNLQAWSALATSAKANTSHNQSASTITTGTFPGEVSLTNADGTGSTRIPRVFVKSTDPGADAADGDLWVY